MASSLTKLSFIPFVIFSYTITHFSSAYFQDSFFGVLQLQHNENLFLYTFASDTLFLNLRTSLFNSGKFSVIVLHIYFFYPFYSLHLKLYFLPLWLFLLSPGEFLKIYVQVH